MLYWLESASDIDSTVERKSLPVHHWNHWHEGIGRNTRELSDGKYIYPNHSGIGNSIISINSTTVIYLLYSYTLCIAGVILSKSKIFKFVLLFMVGTVISSLTILLGCWIVHNCCITTLLQIHQVAWDRIDERFSAVKCSYFSSNGVGKAAGGSKS
jgi:hypothetical protein